MLRPIVSSLRHHKLTVFLMILQVALTSAVACNVLFMVSSRITKICTPSGVAEDELSLVTVNGIDKHENQQDRHAADLAALRMLSGVKAAAAVDILPLGSSESSYGICSSPDALDQAMTAMSMSVMGGCLQPSVFSGTPGELSTLGLRLIAGRDFHPDEYQPAQQDARIGHVSSVIVTRALAERLFQTEDVLGKSLYMGDHSPMRIVGVVDRMLRPVLRANSTDEDSLIVPSLPNEHLVTYVLRSAPADRDRLLKAAVATLMRLDPNRLIDEDGVQTFAQLRTAYFHRDVTMISLLVMALLALLFVTALGIAGLANFWIQQRRRIIGIRRAIGATRRDILLYVQTENFMIVTAGIVPGLLMAYGFNAWLMWHYALTPLPSQYLPVGALVLWLLGQCAVLGPALRAASVPPVLATRSI